VCVCAYMFLRYTHVRVSATEFCISHVCIRHDLCVSHSAAPTTYFDIFLTCVRIVFLDFSGPAIFLEIVFHTVRLPLFFVSRILWFS